MGSRKKKSRSRATTTPVYLPGQKQYIPQYVAPLQQVYSGDFAAPIIQAQMRAAEEQIARQAGLERAKIAESPMSEAARQRALAGLSEGAVTSMAQVPQMISQQAMKILGEYALKPPQMAYHARATEGGGWGVCCFTFCAAAEDDPDLLYAKLYKDRFYNIDSTAARGYKTLSLFLVPLMMRKEWVKKAVRWAMVKPMMRYARAFYEGEVLVRKLVYPIAKFWSTIFSIVGMLFEAPTWTTYMQLHRFWRKK